MSLPNLGTISLIFRALRHPRTPRRAAFPLLVGLAYLIMPFDVIPDMILGLGQLDDLTILSGLAWLTLKMIPSDVRQELDRSGKTPDGSG